MGSGTAMGTGTERLRTRISTDPSLSRFKALSIIILDTVNNKKNIIASVLESFEIFIF